MFEKNCLGTWIKDLRDPGGHRTGCSHYWVSPIQPTIAQAGPRASSICITWERGGHSRLCPRL